MLLKLRETNLRETSPPETATSSDTSNDQTVPMPNNASKPKKGFAAMEPDKRRHVAAKGGKISRGGGRSSSEKTSDASATAPDPEYVARKRGFAAMDPDKRRAIASTGGKMSHGGGRPPKNKNASDKPASGSKRGFAAMDPEKRKRVAALGGKTSQRKGKK